MSFDIMTVCLDECYNAMKPNVRSIFPNLTILPFIEFFGGRGILSVLQWKDQVWNFLSKWRWHENENVCTRRRRGLAIIQQCSECAHEMSCVGMGGSNEHLEPLKLLTYFHLPDRYITNVLMDWIISQERSWRGRRWTSWSKSAVTLRTMMVSFLMNVSCKYKV